MVELKGSKGGGVSCTINNDALIKLRGSNGGGVSLSAQAPPPYTTPLVLFHRNILESSSTGSSFPAVVAKPAPLAVSSRSS